MRRENPVNVSHLRERRAGYVWIRRAVKVNNDLMKIIREELHAEQPFNRPFTPDELLKYPPPSDMSQIKLLWFVT